MASFSILVASRGGYDERPGDGACDEHGSFSQKVYFPKGAEGAAEIGRLPRSCPKCVAEADAARERAEAEARIQQRMTLAQIPSRYATSELENYRTDAENGEAYSAVMEYANGIPGALRNGRSILMLGTIGTGKTHLAVGLLKRAIRAGSYGRYCTVGELLREIRATWKGNGDRSEKQLIEYFGGQGLLVLDEVGVQRGSEDERVLLFAVLNERYERMLPTVVCGNVTVEELKACLDERCVDRLREKGGTAVVFTGNSRRRVA